MNKPGTGPLLIMLAAALWAADALLRTNLTQSIPSASIVFIEHLVGFVILSPFFFRSFKKFRKLTGGDWARLVLLTVISSVAGTILFTEALGRSFAEFDFTTPVLLQKLQPIFVIALAAIFLKEKITIRYLALVPVALIGSYLISFGAEPVPLVFGNREMVFVMAIGAALAWGSGTIVSKKVLEKLTFSEATSLRFLLAIPVAYIASLILNQTFPLTGLGVGEIWRFIVIAFTTGAGAVLIYYRGLKKTPARIATIAELTFPIVSILIAITSLNPYGAPQILSLANIFGIILLLIAILMISFDRLITGKEKGTEVFEEEFI